MIKTYKSNTNISINVVLQSKKNLHISFVAMSNGSSVFTTDREEVQNAIENHYKFGKLFVLASVQGNPSIIATKNAVKEEITDVEVYKNDKTTADTNSNSEKNVTEENTEKNESVGELKKVTVSDIAVAKDYLADHCGVSRTMMRSTKSILEQAVANGIEFVGL
ncbi:MAG: hypothetical protein RSA66_08885 [Muribaculaceae bacterium]